jgi:Methyltransferase domain
MSINPIQTANYRRRGKNMFNLCRHGEKNQFRARRAILFQDLILQELRVRPSTDKLKILDIGGETNYWEMYGDKLDWTRISLTLANIFEQKSTNENISFILGDARNLTLFSDNSFDIVSSNSVIEHVGLFKDRQQMATEVRRLAPRYFVQTPNFWFPFEPRYRVPIFHWLPELMRARILMTFKCGNWPKAPDYGTAFNWVQGTFMLNRRQVEYLFPDSRIVSETMFGLAKSFIAIR